MAKEARSVLTPMEAKLLKALEPKAKESGIEIVTIEITGAKKAPTIRVYVDTPGGVSFDTLCASQAWINEVVDRIDPFPGAYMMEVSSPGIDRPLRTLEHFARFAGEDAVLKTVPINGRSRFTGVLGGVEDGSVLVNLEDGTQVSIPLDAIKRAHTVGKVDFKKSERN